MTVFYDKKDNYFQTVDVYAIIIKFDHSYFVPQKTVKPLSVSFYRIHSDSKVMVKRTGAVLFTTL